MRKRSDLIGRNIVVYDLETKVDAKAAGGWKNLDKMGISSGALFDYVDLTYSVYLDDNMGQLAKRLNQKGTIIVGFNIIDFDNNLLRACGYPLADEERLMSYDLLQVSRVACTGSPQSFEKGFRLDDHLKALGLPVKTGDGAFAPKLYQDGKLGELIDYNLKDVHREKALFEYVWANGTMACAAYPKLYAVPTILESWLK